ncbi:hypothetical protein K435DRAFT_747624 [Dendrothele bispora CBS 962.96]|uniref:DUF202 domain-containing protein n=1 Tax=Dendrothele bispora (strain CBS 962.96) TaxID=1314807 RepID=A0A4S8ML52_DENBC|nr:hypothetical protein K435DRAFT_747624 [Dendrothele bispora CBS 962.96]
MSRSSSHSRSHTLNHNNDRQPSSENPPRGHRRRSKTLLLQPSLVLENSGSVARDHLASERTFLAYVRTSLAIASTGVAIVQLFTMYFSDNIQVFAKPLGSVAVCFGISVLMIGTFRYFLIQSSLTHGKFPVTRVTIVGMAFILTAFVTVVFVILVTGNAVGSGSG